MIIRLLVKAIKRTVLVVLSVLLLLVLLFFYARFLEPNLLIVNNETVFIANLPQGLEGIRIAQVSDLHGKEYSGDRLINKVNELAPDILVITGDVLDRYNRDYSYITRTVGPMQARLGKFFVTGNNEYTDWLAWSEMEKAYRRAGVTVLHNRSHRVDHQGSHLWLLGVDDPNTGHDRINQAVRNSDRAPRVLLAHSPEIINKARSAGIDLVLAGHTHGGQVRLPGLAQRPGLKSRVDQVLAKADYWVNRGIGFVWRHGTEIKEVHLPGVQLSENKPEVNLSGAGTVFTYNMKPGFEKYIAGFYKSGNTTMYVNRGIGETRTPFRLFSPPEIALFELTGRRR